jgi:hypothetical protein
LKPVGSNLSIRHNDTDLDFHVLDFISDIPNFMNPCKPAAPTEAFIRIAVMTNAIRNIVSYTNIFDYGISSGLNNPTHIKEVTGWPST